MKHYLPLSISTSGALLMLLVALLLPSSGILAQGCVPGETWTPRSVTTGAWTSVTYGKGLYVAVSYEGSDRVMTSPDGINWTARTAPSSGWSSITFGNGMFVAVANSGTNRVMTSPDGINWTAQTASEASLWSSVTYGNGKFVAVAYSGLVSRVMSSPDGVTWTSHSACGNDDGWQSVAYGNGVFVAVANSGDNRVMTSTDGETWTARTGALSAAIAITFGGGKFVGVGVGSIQAASTTNGITWGPSLSPSGNWQSVTYGNGLYVAVALGGTNRLMTSTDGASWTARTVDANQWFSVTHGNDKFVAVSYDGTNRVITSPSAVTPSVTLASNDADNSITSGTSVTFTATPTNGGTSPTYVWYKNDVIINGESTATYTTTSLANGDKIKVVMTSNAPCASPTTATSDEMTITVSSPCPPTNPSGETWTTQTSPADFFWGNVTYANEKFVAVAYFSTGNRVMTSSDGVSWALKPSANDGAFWNSVTYGNNTFVAVAGTSTTGLNGRIMTSTDNGETWTLRTGPNNTGNHQWQSVTFGAGLFVAVAQTGESYSGNLVMTSPDGINWTSRNSAADNNWRSVTYGNGTFVAVSVSGSGNRVMTSTDGTTWTSRSSAADNDWNSVTYGNGLFVAVASSGSGNRVMTSPNGINWTLQTTPADNEWSSVTYGDGIFVAVATSGTNNRVMTSSNGINWTLRTSAANNSWRSVTYGNSKFVAVASSGTGNRVMTSAGGPTPSVSIAVNPTGTITSGTSVTFTATPTNGGTSPTYVWYKNNVIINGESAATYTTTSLADDDKIKVVMTSNAPCVSSTTATSNEITMDVLSCPAVSINVPSGVKCEGQSIALTANGTGTYAWASSAGGSFSNSSQSPTNFSANAAGSYTVTLTITNGGCTNTATASFSVNAKPTASINRSVTAACAGVNITLSNQAAVPTNTAAAPPSSSGISWAASDGAFANSTLSPTTWSANTGGSYNISLTVNNGSCSNTASTTVSVNPLPTVQTVTGGGEVCPGTNGVPVGLAPSQSGVTYQLKNGSNNVGSALPGTGSALNFGNQTSAGNYTVVATNSFNCSATMSGSANVTVTTPVGGTASADQTICLATAPNSLSLSGNVGNVTKWQRATNVNFNGATDIAVANTTLLGSTIGNLSTDTWLRAVVQAGSCAPVNSSAVKITVLQPHTASIDATTIVCTGNAISLSASPNENGLTYAWNGPGNFSSNLRTPVRSNATIAMSGAYRLTVARPACGFTSTASVSVVASTPNGKATPRLRALLVNGTVAGLNNVFSVCAGAPVTASIAAISGTSYSWNGPNGSSGVGSLAVTAPTPTLSNAANANTAGNYTLQIFNGCDRSTTVNFSIVLRNCSSTRLAAAEASLGLDISLAPNPVREVLDVNLKGIEGPSLQLGIHDTQGRSLQQVSIEAAEGKAQHRFDLRSLPAGMYLLQAETSSQRAIKKVIKVD